MKIRSISNLRIPENLFKILEEEEYWEEESFEPLMITVEEIQYRGEDMISYQVTFEVLEEYKDINGDEWEELIRIYIEEKEPELVKYIQGDSERSTCVIWTNSESSFKKILGRMIELISSEDEVKKILEKKASR